MLETPSQNQLIKLAQAFHTKKHLGQNFLVDTEALKDIADANQLSANDTVLEIGPGMGFLTRFLAATGAQVVAVDLDKSCVSELERLKIDNLRVVHGDFLNYDIFDAVGDKDQIKVVGNVPYQITAPIVARLFGEIGQPSAWLGRIKSVVLTVQKEVAERFVAKPGGKEYSQVTLLVNYFANATYLRTVENQCFYPVPEVTSAVVRFDVLDKPPINCTNHKLLRQIIKAGFSQRRKMFKNTLSFLKLEQDQLDKVFRQLSFDPQVRAERLSLQQFALLTDAIDELKPA